MIAAGSLLLLLASLAAARRKGIFLPRRPERAIEEGGRRAAIRLGGDFLPWGSLGHNVKWRVRGRLAQIWYGRGDAEAPETVAMVDLRGAAPGPMTIRPRGVFSGVPVGDPGIEALFAVRAEPDLAGRVFADGRMAAALMRLPARRMSSIDITGEALALRVAVNLQEEVELLSLAAGASSLAEALLDVPAGGVEWIDVGGSWRRGVCLLGSGVVRCAACRTPHHEDCWRWTGECATYACRERRWVRS